MTLSQMNDLSTLGLTLKADNNSPSVLNNQVIVEAGDDDTRMAVVHHGTINKCVGRFRGKPGRTRGLGLV